MRHLYFNIEDDRSRWYHSEGCWCQAKDGENIHPRIGGRSSTKYIWFDRDEDEFTITERYRVTGRMCGTCKPHVELNATSPEEAIRKAIKLVEECHAFTTETEDLKAEVIE